MQSLEIMQDVALFNEWIKKICCNFEVSPGQIHQHMNVSSSIVTQTDAQSGNLRPKPSLHLQ